MIVVLFIAVNATSLSGDVAGKKTAVLAKTFKIIGKFAGAYDIYESGSEALETIQNPHTTLLQKTGSVAKVLFKTSIFLAKDLDPAVGIVIGIWDITGAENKFFKW